MHAGYARSERSRQRKSRVSERRRAILPRKYRSALAQEWDGGDGARGCRTDVASERRTERSSIGLALVGPRVREDQRNTIVPLVLLLITVHIPFLHKYTQTHDNPSAPNCLTHRIQLSHVRYDETHRGRSSVVRRHLAYLSQRVIRAITYDVRQGYTFYTRLNSRIVYEALTKYKLCIIENVRMLREDRSSESSLSPRKIWQWQRTRFEWGHVDSKRNVALFLSE